MGVHYTPTSRHESKFAVWEPVKPAPGTTERQEGLGKYPEALFVISAVSQSLFFEQGIAGDRRRGHRTLLRSAAVDHHCGAYREVSTTSAASLNMQFRG